MTLGTNELYSENSRGDQLRMFPHDHGVMPKNFSAVSGGASLVQGVPVAYNSSTGRWGVWTQGGSNGTSVLAGFLMEDVTLNDSGSDDTEVIAQVLLLGVVHRDDINTAAIRALCGGSPSEANLDAAMLADAVREKGLIIEGLDHAH